MKQPASREAAQFADYFTVCTAVSVLRIASGADGLINDGLKLFIAEGRDLQACLVP